MPLTDMQAIAELKELAAELDKRARKFKRTERYIHGPLPLPASIQRARVTEAYRMLMSMVDVPIGRLCIKAASSRAIVGGIRSTDKAASAAVWAAWQENKLDAESKLATFTAMAHGRVIAMLWPGPERPSVTIESPDTVVVRYREGSRHEPDAALRRWESAGVTYATLYRRDFIYKFMLGEDGWERRPVADEDWPLQNPADFLLAREISTNRTLKAGAFPRCDGDLDGALGLIDRINVFEFLRMVLSFSASFPIRAVIGDKIIKDDDGNDIAPYELAADVIAQFENPDVKLVEMPATDVRAFGEAIDRDYETLAGLTQTPSYYLRSIPIQNVSADAIRAADAPRTDRVSEHQGELGEGYEDLLRDLGRLLPDPVDLPADAELTWVDKEFRSISERADAVVKLAPTLPWQVVMELVFQASESDISRWEAMRASDALLNPPPDTP